MYLCKENSQNEITAMFAHEIKNPVSLIKANIELLELENRFYGYENNARVIKRELIKIANMVTDMTGFCSTPKPLKISPELKKGVFLGNLFDDANPLLVNNETFDDETPSNYENLLYIIKNCINNFVCSASSNTVFFVNYFCHNVNLYDNLIGSKIDIILNNIYKNAMEAINHKDGVIQTNVYYKSNFIVVDIIDNGSGFQKVIKNNLFKPFETTKSYGSGLGMSICKKLITHLGGNILVFNNRLKGSTIRLIFNKAKIS